MGEKVHLKTLRAPSSLRKPLHQHGGWAGAEERQDSAGSYSVVHPVG